jgi:hypothetical protein
LNNTENSGKRKAKQLAELERKVETEIEEDNFKKTIEEVSSLIGINIAE